MFKFRDFFNFVLLLNQFVFTVAKGENAKPIPKLTRFSGCYSGCGQFESYMINFHLSNEDCIQFCSGKAYVYAATRGTFCGCTNSLDNLLPVEGRIGEEGAASTTKNKCTTPCSGTKAEKKGKSCHGDDCCGGPTAYSTFSAGKIDAATVLATRVYEITKLMKNLFADKKSKLPGEAIQVKIVVKRQSDKHYRICVKNNDGVICEDKAKAPSLKPVIFKQDSYKREAQHITPSMIKPLEGFDKDIDMTTTAGKFKKTYVVTDKTNTSNNVEAGFDAVISSDFASKKDRQMFKWLAKFKEGFSFTGNYNQTEDTMTETKTTNTIKVEADVPQIGKGEMNFFQDYYDISVKWKAGIVVSGKVEVTWLKEKKVVDLKDFLPIEQRRLYTVGTLRFGDRRTISAYIKLQAAETGILSNSTVKDDSKTIQIEPSIEVTNTTDTIDDETVKDDANKSCSKSAFKVVDKCRHRIDIDLKHDKKLECESTFGGEEVCTLVCARVASLFRGKKEQYTNIVCPRKSDERTTRIADSMEKLTARGKIPCKGLSKFKIRSVSGGYLFRGDKIVVVFDGKGKRNWKLTQWNLEPTDKDGFYYVKSVAKGDYLIRTDSEKDDEKVKISPSTNKKTMTWEIKRRGANVEFISWKGDSLHSAADTFKVMTQESYGNGMEWRIEKD